MQKKSKAKQEFRLGMEWIWEFGSGKDFQVREEI